MLFSCQNSGMRGRMRKRDVWSSLQIRERHALHTNPGSCFSIWVADSESSHTPFKKVDFTAASKNCIEIHESRYLQVKCGVFSITITPENRGTWNGSLPLPRNKWQLAPLSASKQEGQLGEMVNNVPIWTPWTETSQVCYGTKANAKIALLGLTCSESK